MEAEHRKTNVPRIQIPQIQNKKLEKQDKLTLKEKLIRNFIIQLLICLMVSAGVYAAFQSKTDYAIKVQNVAKDTVKTQVNIQEIEASGQRIAGYLYDKLYQKK